MEPRDLQHERLIQLYHLWQQVRADRSLPDRTEFTPERLKPWLGNLALVAVEPGGSYRYRLYGSNFALRFGVEMTNRTVDDLPPDQAAMIREDYDRAVAQAVPVARRYTGGFDILDVHRRIGLQRLETWERLVLPLTQGGGPATLLLVGAYALPEPPRKRAAELTAPTPASLPDRPGR